MAAPPHLVRVVQGPSNQLGLLGATGTSMTAVVRDVVLGVAAAGGVAVYNGKAALGGRMMRVRRVVEGAQGQRARDAVPIPACKLALGGASRSGKPGLMLDGKELALFSTRPPIAILLTSYLCGQIGHID